MLPGFRFLLAAIALAVSILVFGLGAAALLRAAHEEFAASPSWRAAPEPKFAQATKPMLAMLRVEPPANGQKATDVPEALIPSAPAAAPAEPKPTASFDPQPDGPTAPNTQEAAPPPEAAKMETTAAEPPPPTEMTPPVPAIAATEEPAVAEATKIVTDEATSPAVSAPTPTAAEPAKPETGKLEADRLDEMSAPDDAAPTTKVATLSDQSIIIEEPAKATAKPEQAADKARLREQRAKARRRLARHRAATAQQLPLFSLLGQRQQVTLPRTP